MSGPAEVLAEGRFLRLLRRNNWEFVERRRASAIAVIVAVTDDDECVFVEQYREPLGRRVVEWAAGLVGDEEGAEEEELIDAARRELEEETGYRAARLEIVDAGPSSGGLTSEVVTFLLADGLDRVGPGGGVAGEEIVVRHVPLATVDAWLESRIAEGLLIDPKVYSGLYFTLRRR